MSPKADVHVSLSAFLETQQIPGLIQIPQANPFKVHSGHLHSTGSEKPSIEEFLFKASISQAYLTNASIYLCVCFYGIKSHYEL